MRKWVWEFCLQNRDGTLIHESWCYGLFSSGALHYTDVIMSGMMSQLTSLTIVYSTVYSRHRSKKTSMLHIAGLCVGNSPVIGEFPAQRASNTENVSIRWHHHVSTRVSPATVLTNTWLYLQTYICRADSRLAPCQWETSLQNNTIPHWPGNQNQPCTMIC